MKLEITTVGKAELTRAEVTKILKEHLLKENKFDSSSFVWEPPFERVIITFKQVQNDGIVDPYHKNDNKKTSKDIRKGFVRPNYGVGEAIDQWLSSSKSKSVSFQEMWVDVKALFPKLTEEQFKEFVKRTDYKKRLKYTFDTKSGVLTRS